ncbi:uncharacterized protein BDR25DRAFT_345761 [Lindgomyces ingoldianus]|uniref:Uncharacterized protein n=1 Tax=Lindgomyces ingoldianus TaxID=673940 RepID=A0ACB6QGR6_9PLEO|nr:uncharacterized protein BDR25DRAFT_345761 [Lindgomyces ingoldianus]KAF2466189.1 hypothetical protein BDR25DRAFT_345761 [Lindgomyces ingoldianus]
MPVFPLSCADSPHMERIFPIRCTILNNNQNLSSDNQNTPIKTHEQSIVVVESSHSGRSDSSNTSPATTSLPIEHANPDKDEMHRWPPSISVEEILEMPPQGSPQPVYAGRSEYAYSDETGHGIVSGKRTHITRCEDEPIHIPGAIQSHGMLIGLEVVERPDTTLRYLCRVVSENSETICKYTPRVIFDLDNFLLVFPAHQRLIFQSHAQSVIALFKKSTKSAEPKVFSVSFLDPSGYIIPAWCAMHFLGGDHHLLICEFELQESLGNIQAELDNLPSTPYNTMDSDPIDAASSFSSRSEPLNITVDTVDMFQGEGRTMDVVNIISQIQLQLSMKNDIQDLLDAIVGIIQELTGFHRCMVYRFDEDYNGTVVAELINPQACSDVYKGLHFPASDIPKQARELYKINRVRLLFDRESNPCRLICRNISDLGSPLDLTHSYLRAMSPVHLKYLENMAVRSTMSVSLKFEDELWGLICCHSYGPRGLRVSFPVLMQIDMTPQACISASSDDLLRLFQADFGFLVVHGEARTIGKLPSYSEAVTLLRYVYFRNFPTTFATKNITQDFSDLAYETEFEYIAGLLFIPLSHVAGDFIVFFRKNQIREVNWAGNPNMAKIGALEPRNSFKKWTEIIKGTCRPWSDEQFEAAAMTRLVYGNFIRVWREKEAALHDSRMKRLLLLNLSHEMRTPLNAVLNYLELALEKPLDQDTKELLTQSHSASKSLIYVIDDLLHLTGGSNQQPLPMVYVTFELPKDIQVTLDQLQKHAVQKSLSFDVITDTNLPRFVRGDLQRIQQGVTSLVTNAIKNVDKGGIVVHLGARSVTTESCVVQFVVQDTGRGMSERDLDDLFQEFEQVPDEDVDLSETHEDPPRDRKEAKLGLGLALLARYVKHSGGQIRGQSIVGRGSTFSLDVPLKLAMEGALKSHSCSSARSESSEDRPEKGSEGSPDRSSIPPMGLSNAPTMFQLHLDPSRRQNERSTTGGIRFHHNPIVSEPESSENVDLEIQTLHQTPRKEKITVLVADDNSINLAILQRRLEIMGHEVKTSRDGQQCLEAFQKHRHEIEFILMDINMPLVDGIQSTGMIRADESEKSPALEPSSPSLIESSLQPRSLSKSDEGVHPRPETRPKPAAFLLTSPPLTNPRIADLSGSSTETSYFHMAPQTEPSPPSSDPVTVVTQFSQSTYPGQLPLTSTLPQGVASQRDPQKLDYPPFPGRVPIFAVSASLEQHSQASLEAAGFDGWLSKPIDFKRLSVVLEGALSRDARAHSRCKIGDFTRGGWFR